MNKGFYLLFYAINPFFALLRELYNLKKTSLPYVLMFFCAFYGSSQFIGEEGVRYKDGSAYRDKFYEMHDNVGSWENFKSTLFDGETTFDLVVPLVTYITSSFTRNVKVFFIVCGFIFGYFYGKNIEFIIQNVSVKNYNKFLLFFFLVFALLMPFWSGLNGLRFNIGIHVFFYGVTRFIRSSEKKYLIYIFLAAFFHFSLIFVVVIFFAFFLTPLKRITITYFGLFIVTFIIAESNVGFVTETVRNYSPAAFQVKSDTYTQDEYVENFKENFAEGRSWHALIYGKALSYSMFYLTFITFYFNVKEKILTDTQKTYFSLALLLFSFANIFSQLPSGGRFYVPAHLMAFIPILYFYSRTVHKEMFQITFIPLLFWMVVHIRDGFDLMTAATIFANPLLIWFDFLNQVPMIDYIK